MLKSRNFGTPGQKQRRVQQQKHLAEPENAEHCPRHRVGRPHVSEVAMDGVRDLVRKHALQFLLVEPQQQAVGDADRALLRRTDCECVGQAAGHEVEFRSLGEPARHARAPIRWTPSEDPHHQACARYRMRAAGAATSMAPATIGTCAPSVQAQAISPIPPISGADCAGLWT